MYFIITLLQVSQIVYCCATLNTIHFIGFKDIIKYLSLVFNLFVSQDFWSLLTLCCKAINQYMCNICIFISATERLNNAINYKWPLTSCRTCIIYPTLMNQSDKSLGFKLNLIFLLWNMTSLVFVTLVIVQCHPGCTEPEEHSHYMCCGPCVCLKCSAFYSVNYQMFIYPLDCLLVWRTIMP